MTKKKKKPLKILRGENTHSNKTRIRAQASIKQERVAFKQMKGKTCRTSTCDPTTVSFKNEQKHKGCRKLETELRTPF